MLIICELSVHIFNFHQKKDIEGVRLKMDISLCGLIESGWWWAEINVVKLKYPLKHYCKQSAIDIKKSVFNKVSTFVRLWKWNDLEKSRERGEWVNIYGSRYVSCTIIDMCFVKNQKISLVVDFFYPLFSASSINLA